MISVRVYFCNTHSTATGGEEDLCEVGVTFSAICLSDIKLPTKRTLESASWRSL